MTIATFRFEPSTRIMLSAVGAPTINFSSNVTTPVAASEEMDRDERRWQLEWERRNIED
jgi:hypothetical protein